MEPKEKNYDELHRRNRHLEDTHDALHGELSELHEENTELRAIAAEKDAEIAKMKEYIARLESGAGEDKDSHGHDKQRAIGEQIVIGDPEMSNIIAALNGVEVIMDGTSMATNLLTTAARRRFRGAGERRYGFIEKTFALSHGENVFYYPAFSSLEDMESIMHDIEESRNIVDTAERIRRMAMDHYLIVCDAAYSVARMYYRNVREASKAGDTRAETIFNDLKTYYETRGRRSRFEPTDADVERQVKAIMHGKKDGKILIEGKAAHKTASEHRVIDMSEKPAGVFSETVKGTVCSSCSALNPEHAKFCISCGKQVNT